MNQLCGSGLRAVIGEVLVVAPASKPWLRRSRLGSNLPGFVVVGFAAVSGVFDCVSLVGSSRMSTKLSGFGNAPVAATSAAVRVSILTGVVIFRPCRGPQRSPGAVETQCERRSVSEACRRDRAAFRGHESAVLHSIADCNKWRLLWLIAGSAGQID